MRMKGENRVKIIETVDQELRRISEDKIQNTLKKGNKSFRSDL